jgi:hypothetical protein
LYGLMIASIFFMRALLLSGGSEVQRECHGGPRRERVASAHGGG